MSGKYPLRGRKKAVGFARDESVPIKNKKTGSRGCSSPLTSPPVLPVGTKEPIVVHETMPILKPEKRNAAKSAITAAASGSSVQRVGNQTDVRFRFSLPPVETNPLYWDTATLWQWLKHIPVFGRIILPAATKYHLNGESFMICNVEEFAAEMGHDEAVKACQVGTFLRQCVRQWPHEEDSEGPCSSTATNYH